MMRNNGIDDQVASSPSTSAMIAAERDNSVDENTIDDATDHLREQEKPSPTPNMTKDELLRMLSERHILQLTPQEDELLDPIERTVRYIVPIPKYYYWDVLKAQSNKSRNNSEEDDSTSNTNTITADQIPYTIKSWHTIIGLCESIGTWTNNHIAQPIASFTGLTGPRFHEVIDSMTPQEMQQSQRIVQERQLRDQIHRQV